MNIASAINLDATDDPNIWADAFMAYIDTNRLSGGGAAVDRALMLQWFARLSCAAENIARDDQECDPLRQIQNLDRICTDIHQANVDAGWWSDLATGERKERNVGELLMLIVSEIAEGMEGHRKGLMDDKLSHRPMLEVELADAFIRIADTAKGLGLDLAGAVAEKRAYNAQRLDHKREARMAEGGKAY